jgi:ATP-binding cassette subfamily F protein uup
VGRLSGGERARILLARLMLQPADLLILDEPTNDLDIPTLEVLEETLTDFPGALVLVTRDRFLLERVSTLVLALDGTGGATFFADYSQWEAAREEADPEARDTSEPSVRPNPDTPPQRAAREGLDLRRLTYLEKREWEQMEATILDAEEALAACREQAEDPAVASDSAALRERWAALEAVRAEVDSIYRH